MPAGRPVAVARRDVGERRGTADPALQGRPGDGPVAEQRLPRDGVQGEKNAEETGGLSGAPVFERSTAVLRKLADALAGEVPIIGVGGIMRGDDARAKIKAGASLVQLYTGFIYRGPELIGEAAKAIAAI